MARRIEFNAAIVRKLIADGGEARQAGDNRQPRRDIPDALVRGLWLRISAPGNARWTFRGGGEWLALGQASEEGRGSNRHMSLKEARDIAAEYARLVKQGLNPRTERDNQTAAAEAEKSERQQAARAAAEELARLDARLSVADAVERYIAHSDRQSAKGQNRERNRTLRTDIVPALGHLKLEDLTDDHIQALIDEAVEAGLKRKPSKLYAEMSAFITWALERKHIRVSPLPKAKPGQSEAGTRFLAPSEVHTFLTRLPHTSMSEPIKMALELQLRLGMRIGEVLKMRVKDIRLKDDVYVLPKAVAKNGKETRVALPAGAKALIMRALEAREDKRGEWLFPSDDGDPYDETVPAKALKRALEREDHKDKALHVGFVFKGHFKPHDLRRTCASHLEGAGVGKQVVQFILNHRKKIEDAAGVYMRADLFEQAYDALVLWDMMLAQMAQGHEQFEVSPQDRRERARAAAERRLASMMGAANGQ